MLGQFPVRRCEAFLVQERREHGCGNIDRYASFLQHEEPEHSLLRYRPFGVRRARYSGRWLSKIDPRSTAGAKRDAAIYIASESQSLPSASRETTDAALDLRRA